MKVDNKKASTALIELSGGIKVNATMKKEALAITKLYISIIKIIGTLPENITKKIFYARFYGNCSITTRLHWTNTIYIFIQTTTPTLKSCLYMTNEEIYFRKVYLSFRCPTTPRLLVDYIRHIPELLKGKAAVIKQILKF